MRFVIAIVAFVVAAVMIAVGIGQRTIWAPPRGVVASTTVKGGAPFTVIEGGVLNAREGQQTLLVSGSSSPFVAYGRTADVLAWVGDQKYARVSYDAGSSELTSKIVTPKASADQNGDSTSTPTPAPTSTPTGTPTAKSSDTTSTDGGSSSKEPGPNPIGSDLWLEEYTGSSAGVTQLNVPDTVSVIVASDGTKPAPNKISVAWPLDDRTPWSGPLVVGGIVLLLLGLVLYLFALRHMRRSRGPRRGGGGPKMPKPPKSAKYKPTEAVQPPNRGRRSIGRGMIAVPVLLAGTLVLSGCSSEYWPTFGDAGAPTQTSTPIATDLPGQGKETPPPAVTGPQLDNIVANISSVATQADAKKDAALAKTRFSGPALAERTANYTLRSKKANAPAPQAIPAADVVLGLPEATDGWPRVVSAVVSDPKNKKAAPLNLVMVQNTPRDNYSVEYAVALEADAQAPKLPPTSIGTSVVPPDSKLLVVPPSKVASYYADVFLHGAKSKYYDLFDSKSDKLSPQVGSAYQAEQIAKLPKTASLAFAVSTDADPVAMATIDSGALMTTDFRETATIKPTEAGATVNPGNPNAQALTGVSESKKGQQITYEYQLLFYVPPADSKEKIRMLGFTQSLISAKEL